MQDNLRKKFVNITKGTKYITSFIDNQPTNIKFHDNVIEELLKYHPDEDKIKDVEYLIIRIRPPYNNKALYIKNKNDEHEDDVSYKYCLRALFDKFSEGENHIFKIMKSFRDAIHHTKRKEFFLNNMDDICQQCEKIDDNIHIDHYRYTFQQILDEYIYNNEINFASIEVFENSNNEY